MRRGSEARQEVGGGKATVQLHGWEGGELSDRSILAYGSRRGAAFLDRELYLPQEWAADWVRRQEAGVPEGVAFRTKAHWPKR